jgi:glycosyltransferase involved in cell wall biosynthesis
MKISIIVAAYNEEKLLPRCVESLLAQTLQDIEIILVNDASADSTLEIMQGYQKKYPQKIKVINSVKNLRLGGARNLGISVASGEYIAFCDSDDWVEINMYEALYNMAVTENDDICYCFRRQVTETGTETKDSAGYFFPIGEINDLQRKEIIANYSVFLQKFIYKRNIFVEHNIRFPEHIFYEDCIIDPLVIPYIKRIGFVNHTLYNYLLRSNSIVHKRNEVKYKDMMTVHRLIVEEYKKRGLYEQYKNEINFVYFRKAYISCMMTYLSNIEKPKTEAMHAIINAMLEVDPLYRKNPYFKAKPSYIIKDFICRTPFFLKILKFFYSRIK